jgi:hypothetical protein
MPDYNIMRLHYGGGKKEDEHFISLKHSSIFFPFWDLYRNQSAIFFFCLLMNEWTVYKASNKASSLLSGECAV